jgi:predicted SAM-dependent methyltransferase
VLWPIIGGDPPLPIEDGQADRLIANDVLDLMTGDGARRWLAEAHRILRPDGLLAW